MSVFKVVLNQGTQGTLDTSLNAGVSLQRSMWAPGPHGTFRKLLDGSTFTDTNYWKRYTTGVASVDTAFLQLLTDDGTPWDDNNTLGNIFTKVIGFTLAGGSTFTTAGNSLDVLGTYGGYAVFTQVTTNAAIKMKINGAADAILSIAAGTQIFDTGDLTISSVSFDNSASGATTATVSVMLSIRTVSPT